MSVKILNENNPKYNSFYIYTYINDIIEKKNDNLDLNIIFDQSILMKYIFRESNPRRINNFELLLWIPFSYGLEFMFEKMIDYYYDNNNNNNVYYIKYSKSLIKIDFDSLCKRYLNYNQYLLYETNNMNNIKYSSMIYRKLLLNLVLFMEREYLVNNNDNNNNQENKRTVIIIQHWHYVNISRNILRDIFIPIAFTKWYENYSFYDYICIKNDNNNVKNILYKTFYEAVLNCNNNSNNNSIEIIDKEIEKVVRKYTLKLFYKL